MINPKDMLNVIKKHKCTSCGSSNLKLVSYLYNDDVSAYLYECIDCQPEKNEVFVYSKYPLSTPNVIINIVNVISSLEEQIKNEPSHGQCSKCNKGEINSIFRVENRKMAIDIIECSYCKFKIAVISIVNATLIAYSYNIKMAKKLAEKFPEISLVMCVSAFEVYCKQIFQYYNDLNEYLVKNRKVSFQNLEECKLLLKKAFNINIVKLKEKDWTFIKERFKLRNRIIHHASFLEDGKKIELTKDEIMELIFHIDDLVRLIERELYIKDMSVK